MQQRQHEGPSRARTWAGRPEVLSAAGFAAYFLDAKTGKGAAFEVYV